MSLANWLVRRYPRAWRKRYEAEMLAVLEQHHVTIVTVFDLFFGMITARLDPHFRSESRLMVLSSPRKATWLFLAAIASFMLLAQTADGITEGAIQVIFFGQNTFPTNCAPNPPDVPSMFSLNQLGTETLFCNRPPLLLVVYLLVGALVVGGSLYWAVTGRHWGFLVLAVACFAAPVVVYVWLVQQPVIQQDLSELTTPLGFVSVLGELEALMGVLFLSVVKGTQAIAARLWRLLGLVLGVDLSLILVFLYLANTSRAFTLTGNSLIGEFGFYSATFGIAAVLLPFAAIGIMLLAVAGSDISKRVWHLVLGGASLLLCVMVAYLALFTVGVISEWHTTTYQYPRAVFGAGLLLLTLLALIALRGMVRAVVASSHAVSATA